MEILQANARRTAEQRQEFATILRQDATSYRADRLVEIDRE
jgi:hypothetical protein